MKDIVRNKLLITILMAAVVIFIMPAFPTGCSPEPVSIEELVLCKEVDGKSAPVEPTDIFPAGIQVIYLSAKVKNISTEDKLSVTWNYHESGEEITTADFISDRPGSGYIGFNVIIEQGFPKGNYTVDVHLNDTLHDTLEFKVE